MATALHSPRTDNAPAPHINGYPLTRPLSVTDLEFKDGRYQPLTTPLPTNRHTSAMVFTTPVTAPWSNPEDQQRSPGVTSSPWINSRDKEDRDRTELFGMDANSYNQQPVHLQKQDTDSNALPPGAARRVIEPYYVDREPPVPFSTPEAQAPTTVGPNNIIRQDLPAVPSPPPQTTQTPQTMSGPDTSSPQPGTSPVPAARHLPVPSPGTGPESSGTSSTSPTFSPPVPFSVVPAYKQSVGISISPKPRVYAQQPVYITPPSAPKPINPVYSPPLPGPPEEVCIECAMRDQDMADVDVASPGVWDRDSDVLYDDLVRREREEQASGVVRTDSSRPRATGGRLTETNLKIWLSVVSSLI